jgi:hypothetical protein
MLTLFEFFEQLFILLFDYCLYLRYCLRQILIFSVKSQTMRFSICLSLDFDL